MISRELQDALSDVSKKIVYVLNRHNISIIDIKDELDRAINLKQSFDAFKAELEQNDHIKNAKPSHLKTDDLIKQITKLMQKITYNSSENEEDRIAKLTIKIIDTDDKYITDLLIQKHKTKVKLYNKEEEYIGHFKYSNNILENSDSSMLTYSEIIIKALETFDKYLETINEHYIEITKFVTIDEIGFNEN